MDNNTIFNKTEKARQEIKDKTIQVPLKLRFLLSLIDGMHTVGQLHANHGERFGDINVILQDFVNQGLIEEKSLIPKVVETQSQAPKPSEPTPSKSTSSKPAFHGEIFLEGKKLLIGKLLVKIYGPMANSMLPQLNNCQTESSLYTYTKELSNLIAEGLNKRKAGEFLV